MCNIYSIDSAAFVESLGYFPGLQHNVHSHADARHAAICHRLSLKPLSNAWTHSLEAATTGKLAAPATIPSAHGQPHPAPPSSPALSAAQKSGQILRRADTAANTDRALMPDSRPGSSGSTTSVASTGAQVSTLNAKVDRMGDALQAMCLEMGQLLYTAKSSRKKAMHS